MKYMGSKAKYAKELLPIILKDRTSSQWYVEPFVGGANMIDKVQGNRIGNDLNYVLIQMWKSLQRGWTPPQEISKEQYYDVKYNGGDSEKYPPELVGWVAFNCCYSGVEWGGMQERQKQRWVQ